MREAIRGSGAAGRRRVEASERRHAEVEHPVAAVPDAPVEGDRGDMADESNQEQLPEQVPAAPEAPPVIEPILDSPEDQGPWGSEAGDAEVHDIPMSSANPSNTLGAVTTARSKEWQPSFRDTHNHSSTLNATRFARHVVESVAPWEPTPTRRQPNLLHDAAGSEREFLMKLAHDLGADPSHVVSEVYFPPRVTRAAGKLRHLVIAPGLTR